MEWTIQDLGAAGEFVGAIAVIVTLIYLARQIRDSGNATKALIRQGMTDQLMHFLFLGQDPARLADAMTELRTTGRVSEEHVEMLMQRANGHFRMFEGFYSNYKRGLIDDAEWAAYENGMRVVLRNDPFFRRLWRQSRSQGHVAFPADFVALVDPLYEEAERSQGSDG